MKKLVMISMLLSVMLGAAACSGAFWTGAGGGTVATGAGYEINANRQIARLNKDLAAGKITKAEYDIRKDQTKRMSIAY